MPTSSEMGFSHNMGTRGGGPRGEVVGVVGRRRGDDDRVGLGEHRVAVGQRACTGGGDGSFHGRRIGVVHDDVDAVDARARFAAWVAPMRPSPSTPTITAAR